MDRKRYTRLIYGIAGIIIFCILTVIDQISKYAAVMCLKDQPPFIIIRNVFELQYLENRGAAFGIMQGQRGIFLIITIIILAAAIYIYAKLPLNRRFSILRCLIVLISAGAVGNMIDRIRQGYVVDFFYISAINFPIFNVADIYVTCSAIALIITVLFYYKDDDLKQFSKCMKPGAEKNGRTDK